MISKTRWVLVLAVLMVWLVPSVVRAVSVRDLVELSRAGLSDEILLAVLEADPTIFDLDAGTIIEIRAAGLSERVIAAMLRSGRALAADESESALDRNAFVSTHPYAWNLDGTQPGVVVIGGRPEPRPEPIVLYVPVPVFGFTHHVLQDRTRATRPAINTQRGFGRFMNEGFRLGVGASPASPPGGEPVYWGWGGRKRPGSWNVAPSR